MDLRIDELRREKEISDWMTELAETLHPQSMLIKNIRIISEEHIDPNQEMCVFIDKGTIASIDEEVVHTAEITIDGQGKFLLAGLIDMHIHTRGSNAHHLLNLLHGITTTREMCGFPWMLRRRSMIEENAFLGPRMIVAGTMLNYRPFYQFTQVVRTPEEIRAAIKNQIADGYEWIKIWNHMPAELVKVIGEECKKAGIPLAGHIPNEVTVRQAVDFGFRTMEHLKGYIIDSGVILTEEDYVESTPPTGVWNCPTFLVFFYEALLGDEALEVLNKMPEHEYISPYIRDFWHRELREREKDVEDKQRNVPLDHLNLQKKIFQELRDIDAPYIVGTDFGGGYPLCLPGLGFLRELQYMHDTFEIPYTELLQKATSEAAIVLSKENTIGSIRVGSVADLVIFDHDPRVRGIPLESSIDVITAGRYISRDLRKELLKRLQEFYQRDLDDLKEDEIVKDLFEYYLQPANRGIIKPQFVSLFASYLKDKDELERAIKIAELNLELVGSYFDYFEVGELYERAEEIKIAQKRWRHALELNPYFDHLREKLEGIQTSSG